jgi:hypothetical protein
MSSVLGDWIYWHFYYNYTQLQSLTIAHNRWPLKTCSFPSWTTSFFSSAVTDLLKWRLSYELSPASMSLGLILRPTASRPVCLGIKHPSGAYDQICITVRQLRVCCCGPLSLTKGRVCLLQLLLALASVVILGSKPRGTLDRILLSQIRDFPFRRLLRLAGLW